MTKHTLQGTLVRRAVLAALGGLVVGGLALALPAMAQDQVQTPTYQTVPSATQTNTGTALSPTVTSYPSTYNNGALGNNVSTTLGDNTNATNLGTNGLTNTVSPANPAAPTLAGGLPVNYQGQEQGQQQQGKNGKATNGTISNKSADAPTAAEQGYGKKKGPTAAELADQAARSTPRQKGQVIPAPRPANPVGANPRMQDFVSNWQQALLGAGVPAEKVAFESRRLSADEFAQWGTRQLMGARVAAVVADAPPAPLHENANQALEAPFPQGWHGHNPPSDGKTTWADAERAQTQALQGGSLSSPSGNP